MLVLTRREGQDIVIGDGADEVRIRVVEMRGKQVRIGVVADKMTPIRRGEVPPRIESPAVVPESDGETA